MVGQYERRVVCWSGVFGSQRDGGLEEVGGLRVRWVKVVGQVTGQVNGIG